ncbi:tryptophan synthase subunit alpha [Peribacillus loiseleuriae]|uniref:tryptophan synthase n=1 Tax=Peribacillus loiseleuriae TaxID=1679170 RepID=A0A0K9GXS9_9BACI|nr:tryptophan synthase subunit alpha [Peribacillus loiseleuriae]KMY51494.1 hypothetical protein AC625_19725 [Peribacillus loiseleuriae]
MAKLICYLSNGYPSLEKTMETADLYVEGGCDIIEVDIPTDNPFLDNEFIGGRMSKAFEQDQNYDHYLGTISTIRKKYPEKGVLIVLYEHTLIAIGVEKFIKYCLDNNTKDIILAGPENNDVKNILMKNGIRVSSYIQFHLPADEIELARNSNGFIYLQAKSVGVEKNGCDTLKECINYLREIGIDQPIYCGVGVSTQEDVRLVSASGGDAAFIGSAVLKKQDDPVELVRFISELKVATNISCANK